MRFKPGDGVEIYIDAAVGGRVLLSKTTTIHSFVDSGGLVADYYNP